MVNGGACRVLSDWIINGGPMTGLFAVLFMLQAPTQTPATPIKGSFEKITVHGRSLEGNLEGDSPDRDVFVYLPPSYGRETARRYPVIYFLHGYSVGAQAYVRSLGLPESVDSAMA